MKQNPIEILIEKYSKVQRALLEKKDPLQATEEANDYQIGTEFEAYLEAMGKLSFSTPVLLTNISYAKIFLGTKDRLTEIYCHTNPKKLSRSKENIKKELPLLISALEIMNIYKKDLENIALKS